MIAPGEATWHRIYEHLVAALSEGRCPLHGTPMEPVTEPRLAWLCAWCCRRWYFDRHGAVVTCQSLSPPAERP